MYRNQTSRGEDKRNFTSSDRNVQAYLSINNIGVSMSNEDAKKLVSPDANAVVPPPSLYLLLLGGLGKLKADDSRHTFIKAEMFALRSQQPSIISWGYKTVLEKYLKLTDNLKVDQNNNIYDVLENEMKKWRESPPIAERNPYYEQTLDALLTAQDEAVRSIYMGEVVDCRKNASNQLDNNMNTYFNLPSTGKSVYIKHRAIDLEIRNPSPR